MTTIYLDIRENHLTGLIQKGKGIHYRGHFPLDGLDSLNDIIKQMEKDSGLKPEIAHIIIPSTDIMIENITLQNMPLEYAEMIIRRKMVDIGIKQPLFYLTPIRSERLQQTYMVEAIEKKTAERYIKSFSSLSIKVKTITTSFQANLLVFKDIGEGPFGILNTGEEIMEFTIVADSVPVMYERIPVQKTDTDAADKVSNSKFGKITLFKIAEKFHNILRRSEDILRGQSITNVFLCGHLCGDKELVEILSEIVDVKVLMESDNPEDHCLYTSLKGLIRGVSEKKIKNFLEKRSTFSDFIKKYKRFAYAAMIVYLMLVLSGFLYVESKYRKTNLKFIRATAVERKTPKGPGPFEQEKLLRDKEIPFYEVMRYLANNLPDGIFLEKLNYIGKDDRSTIDLIFMLTDIKSISRDAVLTQLFKILDNSIYLRKHSRPIFSTVANDKEKVVQIYLTVEVD